MAKTKNIEAFCPVCASVQKMAIVGDVLVSQSDSKKWARCKKCKQTTAVEYHPTKKVMSEIENLAEKSTEYSPAKSYIIGELIFHREWNDYGKVISKQIISNGGSSITVEFQNIGNKKLIETINK